MGAGKAHIAHWNAECDPFGDTEWRPVSPSQPRKARTHSSSNNWHNGCWDKRVRQRYVATIYTLASGISTNDRLYLV